MQYGADIYRPGELTLANRIRNILNMSPQPDYIVVLTWVRPPSYPAFPSSLTLRPERRPRKPLRRLDLARVQHRPRPRALRQLLRRVVARRLAPAPALLRRRVPRGRRAGGHGRARGEQRHRLIGAAGAGWVAGASLAARGRLGRGRGRCRGAGRHSARTIRREGCHAHDPSRAVTKR